MSQSNITVMDRTVLTTISIEEFRGIIEDVVDKVLTKKMPKKDDFRETFLTREETAKILNVTLMTLHNWNNKGILIANKIGNKVLFRESDVKRALTNMDEIKYKQL